jgi:hypothetical protein
VKAKVQRVLPDVAYATVVSAAKGGSAPITAEGEAEKPTRAPAAKKESAEVEAETASDSDATVADGVETEARKKTRRGSRGGRRRKKAPTIHVPESEASGNGEAPAPTELPEHTEVSVPTEVSDPTEPPEPREAVAEAVEQKDGAEPAAEDGTPKKRKTRRGSRGGRNRRKKPAAAAPAETGESG